MLVKKAITDSRSVYYFVTRRKHGGEEKGGEGEGRQGEKEETDGPTKKQRGKRGLAGRIQRALLFYELVCIKCIVIPVHNAESSSFTWTV